MYEDQTQYTQNYEAEIHEEYVKHDTPDFPWSFRHVQTTA